MKLVTNFTAMSTSSFVFSDIFGSSRCSISSLNCFQSICPSISLGYGAISRGTVSKESIKDYDQRISREGQLIENTHGGCLALQYHRKRVF